MASPNDGMTWMVSSARTPNVSATMGMNSTPADRHPARCDVSLRWTPTCTAGRVWLGEKARSAARGRGEMEGSRATTAPGGEVDVSRSGERTRDEVGHLLRWRQGSRLGSSV